MNLDIVYKIMEEGMHIIAKISILILETTGVGVILFAGIRGIIEYIRRRTWAQLRMAGAMAFALEFKLGGEILRTLLVRELEEILIVACIIALRGVLNFMIHRDIHEQEALRKSIEGKKEA